MKDKIGKYSSVKLFAIERDDQVNFNLRIFNIDRSAANQLNSRIRLERVFVFEENKLLINSYFCLNCNFCPLVRMFSSAKHSKKLSPCKKEFFLFWDYYCLSYETCR